jgi:hypothetical protein
LTGFWRDSLHFLSSSRLSARLEMPSKVLRSVAEKS